LRTRAGWVREKKREGATRRDVKVDFLRGGHFDHPNGEREARKARRGFYVFFFLYLHFLVGGHSSPVIFIHFCVSNVQHGCVSLL